MLLVCTQCVLFAAYSYFVFRRKGRLFAFTSGPFWDSSFFLFFSYLIYVLFVLFELFEHLGVFRGMILFALLNLK